jgi:hypothetical protein
MPKRERDSDIDFLHSKYLKSFDTFEDEEKLNQEKFNELMNLIFTRRFTKRYQEFIDSDESKLYLSMNMKAEKEFHKLVHTNINELTKLGEYFVKRFAENGIKVNTIITETLNGEVEGEYYLVFEKVYKSIKPLICRTYFGSFYVPNEEVFELKSR